MQKHILSFLIIVLLSVNSEISFAQTVTERNGSLQIIGRFLCNEKGVPLELHGLSSHGLQWYNNCISLESITTLRDEWCCDVFRIPVYIKEGGYQKDSIRYLKNLENAIDLCTKAGIYCIVDWHVLIPGNPLARDYKGALAFFSYLSQKYKNHNNILYEICNEPSPTIEKGGPDWQKVKQYAKPIIEAIRKQTDAVIIVGTPQWSQLIADVVGDQLDYPNIMYSFHFYAGTHSFLKESFIDAAAKIPVFVTEWGVTVADNTHSSLFLKQAQNWLSILQKMKVSWCYWNFSDGKDSMSVLQEGSCLEQKWNRLTASGDFIKKACRNKTIAAQRNTSISVLFAETYNEKECRIYCNKAISDYTSKIKNNIVLCINAIPLNPSLFDLKINKNVIQIAFHQTISSKDEISCTMKNAKDFASAFDSTVFHKIEIINCIKNKELSSFSERFTDSNQKNGIVISSVNSVKLTQKGGKAILSCKKIQSDQAIADLWFTTIDIKSNPVVKIALSSNKRITFRIDLMDVKGNQTNGKPQLCSLDGNGLQKQLEYHYNGCFFQKPPESWQVNPQKINKVLFYVFPDQQDDDVEIAIDSIEIGK